MLRRTALLLLLVTGILVVLAGVAAAHGLELHLSLAGLGALAAPVAALVAFAVAALPLWLGVTVPDYLISEEAKPTGREEVLLQGLAVGVLLFLFLDLMNLSANLGIGLTRFDLRLGLLLAFVLPLLGFARLEGREQPRDPLADRYRVALFWAAGIGFHSLGEGAIMGHDLALGFEESLSLFPLLSFALHKVAEGFTVGVLLGGAAAAGRQFGQGLPVMLSAAMALPAAVGALLGYWQFAAAVTPYVYALGAGALIYVLPKFFRPDDAGDWVWTRYQAIAGGFIIMIIATWLHDL